MPSPLLGIPNKLGVGLTFGLKPRRVMTRNAYPRMPRRALRRFVPRMAATPMWEGGDDDFNAALSRLAPTEELPELRKTVRGLDSLISDAITEEDFAVAARLRDEVRELKSKDPAPLISSLRQSMWAAAEGEQFNEAAKYRDQLHIVNQFLPEYQLAGVYRAWKGHIPGLGDDSIRIVYDGDTLTAIMTDRPPYGKTDRRVLFKADVSKSHERHFVGKDGKTARSVDCFMGEGMDMMRLREGFTPGVMYMMEDNMIGFMWSAEGEYQTGGRILAAAGQRVRPGDIGSRGGGGGGSGERFVTFKKIISESEPEDELLPDSESEPEPEDESILD